jgi:ParB family chromosome partitioning protein
MTNSKQKKKALGRGLDAILSSPETDITSKDISGGFVAGAIAEIELSKIVVNPFQPRTDFDEMELRELADSIKAQGVIQPVTVRKLGFDEYQLIAGERRMRASQMAGLVKIPAFIRIANDEQMLELALIENIHRKDLNAIEVAISYKRLIEECDLTQEKLSGRLGRNRSTITNYLRLLKLPPKVQVALRDDLITMGHARALVTLENTALQEKLLDRIVNEELSVRQIEQIVRERDNPKKSKTATDTKTNIPEKYQETTDTLSRKFGTKVSLRRNNKGTGSIVIKFNNDEELDHIISVIRD